MARENVYLESKPRYEILDGLRGVAAMLVVVFHLSVAVSPRMDGHQIVVGNTDSELLITRSEPCALGIDRTSFPE